MTLATPPARGTVVICVPLKVPIAVCLKRFTTTLCLDELHCPFGSFVGNNDIIPLYYVIVAKRSFFSTYSACYWSKPRLFRSFEFCCGDADGMVVAAMQTKSKEP